MLRSTEKVEKKAFPVRGESSCAKDEDKPAVKGLGKGMINGRGHSRGRGRGLALR